MSCIECLHGGGTIYIFTDYAHWLGYCLDKSGHHQGYWSPSGYKKDRHYYLFNEKHLSNFAEMAGFKVIYVRPVEGVPKGATANAIHFITKNLFRIIGLSRLSYMHIEMKLKKP